MQILFLILFFLKILIIKSQSCGAKDPKNINDCLKDSSKNSICCYTMIQTVVNTENRTDTLCIYVPKSQIFITPYISSLDIGSNEDNIYISLDCGFNPEELKPGEPYSNCGENPQTPYDCIRNSTYNASCCYIKNSNGNSFCVLNNGIYNSNSSYFGVNIICGSNYIKLYKFIFFLVYILFYL